MNIGIIVYSQTGNTLSVAKQLEERLASDGHTVSLERVRISGDAGPGTKDVTFTNQPDPTKFDALVFASPVQAFSLAIPMQRYLERIPQIQGKKIACFVTKQLPFRWTGGNRGIAQIVRACESKGAEVVDTEILVWSKSKKDALIASLLMKVSSVFRA
jgi:flavodoxin